MIVHADRTTTSDPIAALHRLRGLLGDLADRDVADEALAEAGSLEAAVTDAVFREEDGLDPVVDALRAITVAIARGRADEARGAIERALVQTLPERVSIGVPEGFAWYGLHPETYTEAGRRLGAAWGGGRVVVIGLRGIGAALSAAAQAGLEAAGCTVRSLTVRPRAHPFDRRLNLSPALAASLAAERARFVVADEGPGISGTSFAAASEALTELGVLAEQIVLLPSAGADATPGTERGRAAWARHHRLRVGFDEVVWPRIADRLGVVRFRDLSGGAWRGLFGVSPPVHPWHERRKRLALTARGELLWVRFVGIGSRGRALFDRARALHEAGLGPAPVDRVAGHLVSPFVRGRPLQRVTEGLREALVRHLGWVATQPGDREVPADELVAMVELNVREGLGADALPAGLDRWKFRLTGATVAIDGRPQLHEWIATPDGLWKADALDHHDDHFFPGCQDLAWDVAAAAAETGIAAGALAERLPVDPARLPFYAVAYAAWRLGYAALAEGSAPHEPWAAEAERYRGLLRRALERLPA
jgi:hypothetical protein